ncbi:GDNF family receptor alpha-1 [Protopterus annectens]|uniref:GDNF family receptor alpha-1 n=1 Tax=Protopterus annectens TaxID=7888 RepID=UPI001CF9F44E|nr:GDNF family receptor alpha-1 [Protopterus annectens]
MFLSAFYFLLVVMDILLSTEVNSMDCVKASELCLQDQSCSTKYRTLRQCVAGKEGNYSSMVIGPEAKSECRTVMESLKQKPLYNCRCKRGMKKEKNCLRIYWSLYQSLQGNDLLEDTPYEPANNRLSDIFRLAPIISGEPVVSRGNSCLDAAKACNLNDTCKKLRSAYISPCTTSTSNEICNKRKCHKALRQFFDKVPPKHSYGMLFCSCRDTACRERRRQTIVPVCSYDEKEKPNCLNLQETCKKTYVCRSRLADFFTNCQSETRTASGCLKENYANCLISYSGLIGTVMTPNYLESSVIRVAPSCDCSNSGNDKEECEKFLNFFRDNTCLRNAIQAFGNGTDINVWQLAPQAQTPTVTTLSSSKGKGKSILTNEVTTADDANAFVSCSNLQAQKLKSNVSMETELCIPEQPQIPVERTRGGPDGNSISHIATENSSVSLAQASWNPVLILLAITHFTLLIPYLMDIL